MLRYLVAAALCLYPAAVLAQQTSHGPDAPTPTEQVTITGSKLPTDEILRDFVASHTAASPASAKVARWHDGICPGVAGLPQGWNASVAERVREIATLAGAPERPKDCRANIDIMFTQKPQLLLDDVLAKKPVYLGYHDVAQGKRIATVSHALQSWYMTQTVDAQGETFIDDKLHPPNDLTFSGGNGNSFQFPGGHVEYWSGNHLGDERRSELIHVLVVVDLDKVKGVRLNTLADAVAMLALAQTTTFDVCQPVPSISNLAAPDCDARLKTDKLSDTDLAYLHALYSTDPRDSLVQQKSKIAFEMKKSLAKP